MIANLINDRGNAVKNQFVITDGNTIAFQSYNSRVCEIVRPCGMGFDTLVKIGKNWNYSQTTSKHFYSFLRQNGLEFLANKKAIEEAIDRGYARLDQSVAVWFDKTL